MDARQLGWRAAYELLALRVRRPEWAFMNYGCAGLDPPLDLRAADEPDRLCINLYARTIGDVDLTGRDVLEVGSGRGGGSSYVARYHDPRSVVGLDFSAAAVDLCRRQRKARGLTFIRGDAQSMPCADASVDAVLNIESSHCYEAVPTFLAEVHRVLRPGGVLLLADFRPADEVPDLLRALRGCGLSLDGYEDITAEVVTALRQDHTRKEALIQAWLPRPVHPLMRRFAALEGSRAFTAFDTRRTVYLRARLSKP